MRFAVLAILFLIKLCLRRNIHAPVPLNIRRRMRYQHDGAPAHLSIAARQVLNDKYPNR